tara:strand:- start:3206 stop:3727 length:522 start_codon:yes stop_codon:yes gene_type:complete
MSEEAKVSNETVVEKDTENATQEVAQNEYIAESKKYRKRAQDAESRLADLEKKLESQENAKLKEKEEFKTLAEKYESQVNDLNPYKEKYEGLVNQRKTALLEKLPEEDRDNFKDKDLDVLEFMVSKLETKTPKEPQARATVKGSKPIENWAELEPGERRSRWGEILQKFNSNK